MSGEFAGVIICRRAQAPKCWPCRKEGRTRDAVAYCDGPRPRASLRKSETCDTALCGTHRHRVGPNRDLCPPCFERQAASTSIAETAGEPDPVLPLQGDPTLFDGIGP